MALALAGQRDWLAHASGPVLSISLTLLVGVADRQVSLATRISLPSCQISLSSCGRTQVGSREVEVDRSSGDGIAPISDECDRRDAPYSGLTVCLSAGLEAMNTTDSDSGNRTPGFVLVAAAVSGTRRFDSPHSESRLASSTA